MGILNIFMTRGKKPGLFRNIPNPFIYLFIFHFLALLLSCFVAPSVLPCISTL
jgi:hypothetical protein